MKVPSRIIQTAISKDLTPTARASAANLKLLHPDWEYLFFDDEDVRRFIAKEFPQHRTVFDGFRHAIQRIDFFRYLAVFRLGGFYFDLDVFLYENLSSLLDCQCVFPFEELTLNRFLRQRCAIDWEIGNYGFGAAPGDPFLALVIENCIRAQREPGWVEPMMAGFPRIFQSQYEVLNTTGPGLLTRTLAENPAPASGMTVLFPNDVCDPKSWHLFGNYGIHLMDGSWRGRGGYLYRRTLCRWESWRRRRNYRESCGLGAKRVMPGARAKELGPAPDGVPANPEAGFAERQLTSV
jgi:hypothetical protein